MPQKQPPPYQPSNLGAITIGDGDLEQVKFWLRVFNLEPYVEVARADILARPDVKKASVPIIAEYESGRLYWYYAIVLFIDSLGFSGGMGLITFADAENRAKAVERRDKVADMILGRIKERMAAGEMTGHTLTIEPGKES